MNKALLLFFLLFISFALTAQNPLDLLTEELQEHFEASDIPGFSVAIVSEKGPLYQKGFGYTNMESRSEFDENTVLNLGSVSKTVVGLALAKAIEEGKLTMDTEINEVLPFQIANPFFKDSPILIRHLANHTSSILDTKHYGKTYVLDESFEENPNVHQGFLGFLKSHPSMELRQFLSNILSQDGPWYKKKNYLKAAPGTVKEYSNLNAALTAIIIETVSNTSFEEYTRAKIFSPLNMTSTSWNMREEMRSSLATPYFPAGAEVPRYKLITFPDGGLYSNTLDLVNYLQAIINAYAGNSTYLPAQYAKLLLPGDEDENRMFWGMGEKSRNIGHGGSDPGVQTDLQFNADSQIGRIILANVNAEDSEVLWEQYRGIHQILAKYEKELINN